MPDHSTPAPRAVVLLSGGLDSAVTLAAARRDGYLCTTIAFDYGQRHRHELAAAADVAHAQHITDHRLLRLDLRAIGGSALTADIDVPKDRPAHASDQHSTQPIPITYVPARNLIFLSLAAGLAEVIGASDLFIGVNAVDYSGYPDCRRPFIDAFELAATLGTRAGTQDHAPFRVRTPLVDLTKASIIRLGAELNVDFSLTHSCYDPVTALGRTLACGSCDSCLIRRAGFIEAGVPDPTRYAHPSCPVGEPPKGAPR